MMSVCVWGLVQLDGTQIVLFIFSEKQFGVGVLIKIVSLSCGQKVP
jgi:hypothetical protein